MNKKENSTIRTRVIITTFSLIIVSLLIIFILPELYFFTNYFSVPNELTQSDSIQPVVMNDRRDDICIKTSIPDNAIKSLRVKIIVNGEIVPYWKLDIHYLPPESFLSEVTGSDVVCVDPQLGEGTHTLQVIIQPSVFIAYTTHLKFQITNDGLVKYSS